MFVPVIPSSRQFVAGLLSVAAWLLGTGVLVSFVSSSALAAPIPGSLAGRQMVLDRQSCVPVPDGLVARFPFDSGNPGVNIAPATGAALNGTLSNPAPTPVAGVVGGALQFGTNAFITVLNNSALNFGQGNFAVSAWFKTSNTSGVQQIVEKREIAPNGGVRGYSLYVLTGRVGFQMADAVNGDNTCRPSGNFSTACNNFVTDQVFADGNWHHVLVSVHRTTGLQLIIYVDGEIRPSLENRISTPRLGSVDSGANLYIGRRQVPSPVFFDGAIDEVEIYNRSFGLVDAQAIFNAGSAGHCR